MRINTNVPAIVSYNALTQTNNALQKSIQKLSTGLRINTAADDAAGLAISEKMRAQYRGLDQASSNAQDGISMIQTAEGALSETHSILQRMRELSVQAANDTLTQEDRGYIQLEIDQLKEEIDRISTTTQFNKKQLLDGSAAVLWSSDKLSTKAIVNGGLREVDQFGQKRSVEGNFRITVGAIPGQAEIQKTDIFKIKHPNVIMNVGINKELGFESVRVDGLPAGKYSVTIASGDYIDTEIGMAPNATGQRLDVRANYFQNASANASIQDFIDLTLLENISATENMSMLYELIAINTADGSKALTFRVQVQAMDVEGNLKTYSDENFMITTAAMKSGTQTKIGFNIADVDGGGGFQIASGGDAITKFTVGDKFVIGMAATNDGGTVTGNAVIRIDGTLNSAWPETWERNGKLAGSPDLYQLNYASIYGVNAEALRNKEVHFRNFYLNEQNGTTYESDVVVTFNTALEAPTTGGGGVSPDVARVGATFEAAYIGQVAGGDVKLRDLDKFWDANGKFMLDDPKTLQLVQGDGTKTGVTIYSTDTLEDVRKKLNDAVAFGLGQGQYAIDSTSKFVTFVDRDMALDNPNTPMSVAGTFVIQSLVPGAGGRISISGDEDIVKAFSLNVIQEAKENDFRVAVYDAHNGNTIASNMKISGNKLIGVVNPNVDVIFDPMADIEVRWNAQTLKFDLKASASEYETILHLSDNTTVFQIGANESEDMAVHIGNMSALSLGVSNILVTDRTSAARSITIIDNAIGKVSSQRARLGAYQNRLEHTINNLTTASTNLKTSESRIRDVDMAKEMMNFTRLNILSQAGNSMLAQANQLPQNILSLLR